MRETVLTPRARNRALLDRQMLLRRTRMPVPQVLERLVGLQSQTTHTWYLGLWSRLADFTPQPTADLLQNRQIVRIALMRSTIHLVTADDSLWLRPLVQPVIERMTNSNFGRNIDGIDRDHLVRAARELFDERALTFSELGKRLAGRWPGRDPASLAQIIRAHLPLAQIPPRGMWGHSGPAAHLPIDTWLGRPLATDAALESLVRRYLAGFGPATVHDIQHWSGLTRLNEIVERLGSRLVRFRDDNGRELLDLPDAPRPDPDTPAPVRFIYDFDNLFRSHADNSHILTVNIADQGFGGRTGEEPAMILLDGTVAATWRIHRERTTSTLRIRPFRTLTTTEHDTIATEGQNMLTFSTPTATTSNIAFEPPSDTG